MKSPILLLPLLLRVLVVSGLAAVLPAAPAATYTWTGAGFFGNVNHLWSDPNNWLGLAAPSPGEANVSLVFPNSAAPRATTNDIPGLVVASIQFQGANYTVAGRPGTNGLTLASGALTGFGVTASASNCQFLASCPLVLGSVGRVTVADGQVLAVAGVMSGPGGFTKLGLGTLRLAPTQANSFGGAVQVQDGVLELRGGGVFLGGFIPAVTVPGPLIIGGTNEALHPVCRLGQPAQIADTAPVTVNLNGQLLLGGRDETIGSLELEGGTVDSQGGVLTLGGNVTARRTPWSAVAGWIRGGLELGRANRVFDVSDSGGDLFVPAIITGAGGIHKTGPGRLLLGAANPFAGSTLVTEGSVVAMHPLALGATTHPTTVASNATLVLSAPGAPIFAGESLTLQSGARLTAISNATWSGAVTLQGQPLIGVQGADTVLTLDGVLAGPGGFTCNGEGELVVSGPDDNQFSGPVLMKAGVLTLAKGTQPAPRISIPGALKFVAGGEKVVRSLRNETIAGGDLYLDDGGKLQLGLFVTQTAKALVLNGGEIETGLGGVLRIECDVTGTNAFADQAFLKGRVDIGDEPRQFHLSSGSYLNIPGTLLGGSNATVTFRAGSGALVRLQGSNAHHGLTVIGQGRVRVEHPHALGAVAGGTLVTNGASLVLAESVTNETLRLFGPSGDISFGSLSGSVGTNVWRGPVVVENAVKVLCSAPSVLVLDGPISGPGSLVKGSDGEVVLAGAGSDNTLAGPIHVAEGILTLAKAAGGQSRVAVPGQLNIGNGPGGEPSALLRVLAGGQFHTNAVVLIDHTGEFRLEAGTNSPGSVTGAGDLWFGPGARLRTGFNDANLHLSGAISGGDTADPTKVVLEKHGFGVLALMRTNSLFGVIEVAQGNVYHDGAMPQVGFLIRQAGLVSGRGDVRAVRMDGGTYRPGSPAGRTRAGQLTSVAVGPSAGSLRLGLDRFEVDAAPDLDRLRLDLDLPVQPAPAVGTEFLILSNRSASPIIGTLNDAGSGADLAEGGTFYHGGLRFSITYAGGDGNDVVVTRLANPAPAKVTGVWPDVDGLGMNLQGEAGTVYRVETTTDLGAGAVWVDTGMTVVPNGSGHANFYHSIPPGEPRRFFRFVTP